MNRLHKALIADFGSIRNIKLGQQENRSTICAVLKRDRTGGAWKRGNGRAEYAKPQVLLLPDLVTAIFSPYGEPYGTDCADVFGADGVPLASNVTKPTFVALAKLAPATVSRQRHRCRGA